MEKQLSHHTPIEELDDVGNLPWCQMNQQTRYLIEDKI